MASRNTTRIFQSSAECIGHPCVRIRSHEPFLDRRRCDRMRYRKLSQFAGGDAIAALRMTLIANAFLETEFDSLCAAVPSGFARGKVRKAPTSKKAKENKTH